MKIIFGSGREKNICLIAIKIVMGLVAIGVLAGIIIDQPPRDNVALIFALLVLATMYYFYKSGEVATYDMGYALGTKLINCDSKVDRWLINNKWWRKLVATNKEHKRGIEAAIEDYRNNQS